MNITGIELLTNDLSGTIDFYTRILQLEVLEQTAAQVTFIAGKTKLGFLYSATAEHPVYHFAFTIPSNKLTEAFDFIKESTNIPDVPPKGKIADFSNWNAEAFYFYDNNGNILECIARYALNNPSDETFTGKAIQAISEIGLVSGNVTELLNHIREQYQIPVFEKQPPQEQFAVMGNDEGLLILVADQRPWFPTQIKAAPFPVTVFMQQEGKNRILKYPFA